MADIADVRMADALVISRWHRPVFEEMAEARLGVVNCTISVWEDFKGTMENLIEFLTCFRENNDILVHANSIGDIDAANNAGKIAIVLGFQNTSAFEDKIGYVEIFKRLGIGIVQLTYNTQNLVGAGCYEVTDTGLSGFGRDILAEMNRVGMLVDLSHCGPQTTRDAILASKRPVCFTHVAPMSLRSHPRNKTDEEMRLVADRGGVIGVAFVPPFLPTVASTSIEGFIDAVEHVVNLVGEDGVCVSSDLVQDQPQCFSEYAARDKGYGRRLVNWGQVTYPTEFSRIKDWPNIGSAFARRGWHASRIAKILRENFLRVLREAWPAATNGVNAERGMK